MSNKKQSSPEQENGLPPEQETAAEQTDILTDTGTGAEQALPEENEWKERCLRTTAEYHNYRTRTQKEKDALGEDVRAHTVIQFLPVLDNLERALTNETSDEAYYKGVEMIHRQMLDVLQKLRVTEIDAEGQPFDPNLMDAVMHIEDDALPANTVASVFTKGYRMGDRVLRHAMVQVAN